MNVKQEIVAANRVKLTIEISSEEFAASMAVAYKKMVGQISIPGFRKGKAPRKVIENYYGEGVFYEEAFNDCFPKAYEKAIEQEGLFPVEQPEIDVLEIGTGKTCVFTAEFFVKPEVTLGEYKGVEVEKHEHPVTDEMVETQINADRERTSRWVDVERACKMGDRVTIDYSGSVDGVKFEGGTAENAPLELGSGTFIPGFEEQVDGLEIGGERDITVTFPEEYHSEDLAGKEAVFHIVLHGVQEKELSELDDEFAKDVSEFDTFEAYKNDIREKLEKQAAQHTDDLFTNAVVDKVSHNATIEIPAPMIEREIDNMVRDMEMRMMYQGIRMEDYFKFTGMTEETLRGQYRETAELRVRGELVLEAIRKAEGIEADQADVDALVAKYAEQSGIEAEKFTERFTDSDWDYIKTDAATQKTIDFLKANAVAVEPKAEEVKEEEEKAE